MLESSENPMHKFTVLKILQQLPQESSLPGYLNSEPNRVNYLLDTLKEPSEFLRNGKLYTESILLMKKIANNNSDICKLLAFQGIFEILCEIMRDEENIIVKDCTELMKTLLTDFNKNYIRELPCVLKTCSELLLGQYKENILEFLLCACTTDKSIPHPQNQLHFSRLVPKLLLISYPALENQSIPGLQLLQILLKSNSSSAQHLLNADQTDILDHILTHCVLSAHHPENINTLWTLLSTSKQLPENLISKVTCTPGYIAPPNSLPLFNQVVNQTLSENSANIPSLCRTLELLIFANESSKQLAVHLPIDMVSGTVLSKVFSLLVESISQNSRYIANLASLLVVWLHESPDTAVKLVGSIYNYLPQVISYLEKKTEIGQCFTSLVIGLICLYTNHKEIDKIVLKSVGYSEICAKLEFLYTVQEFNRIIGSDVKGLVHEKFSYPMVKVYKSAVQAVKMHFLKEITESVPEDQRELAKLVEAQEAVISMHYLKKGSQSDQDTSQLLQRINDLENHINEKTMEIESLKSNLAAAKYEKNKDARGVLQSMIAMHEKLDLLEFENSSLKRQNFNLVCKIERLDEEIKTYSTRRHEYHIDLKLIETKENLKVKTNEAEFFKEQLTKKEKEYAEALEIIGKQESMLQNIPVYISEPEISEEMNSKLYQSEYNSIEPEFSKNISEENKLKNYRKETADKSIITEPEFFKNISEENELKKYKKETADESIITEPMIIQKSSSIIARCESIDVACAIKRRASAETQTYDSPISPQSPKEPRHEPESSMNWFTEPKDHSDAISFFDNASIKSTSNLFN